MHTLSKSAVPLQARNPIRGAQTVAWARTQAATPEGQAQAVVRHTERVIGDGPETWTFERMRQRVVHSDVLLAVCCGAMSWLIAGLLCLAGWMALVLFLSLSL